MKKYSAMLMAAGAAIELVFPGVGAELTFNWGSSDLSVAANWSAEPTADDTGVVDLSADGASAAMTLSGNLALKGITFKNASAETTLSGAGTLTLGASGLTVDKSQFFNLKVPVAISAAQTWTFSKTHFRTFSTISGTAALTITGCQGVWHRAAPEYGGVITYDDTTAYGEGGGHSHNICLCAAGLWAKSIVPDAQVMFQFSSTGENYVPLSTIFSDKVFSSTKWATFCYLAATHGGNNGGSWYPQVLIADGDSFSSGEICTGGNRIKQTGGSFSASGYYYVGNQHAYGWHYSEWTHHYLQGGTLSANILDVGEYIKSSWKDKCSFVQTGGTSTMKSALFIGGGNQTEDNELARVRLDGGEMIVSGTPTATGNSGIVFVIPDNQYGHGRASFEMTAGTLDTKRIMFGRNGITTENLLYCGGAANSACYDSYGLFDMSGGELKLGAGGIVAGANWNPLYWTNGSYTNTVYKDDYRSYTDARLTGGKVTATDSSVSSVALRFPDAGGSLVWDTNGKTNTIVAPVFGKGKLEKQGAGELRLTDATGLKGNVDIQAGTLRILGSINGPDDGWRWTADAAAAEDGVADGDRISVWTDLNHGLVATNRSWFIHKGSEATYTNAILRKSAPKLELRSFGGEHAGLKFDDCQLTIPADLNPLVDQAEITVAFAFKMYNSGGQGVPANYCGYYSGNQMFTPGASYYHDEFGPWIVWTTGGRVAVKGYPGLESEHWTRMVRSPDGNSLNNNGVHVCVTVVRGDFVSLMTDGLSYTNVTWSPTSVPKLYRRSGSASKEKLPFNIGGSLVDSWNFGSIGGMTIAEMRIYKRGLTQAEQKHLSGEMLATYGGNQSARLSYLNTLSAAEAEVGGMMKKEKSYVTPRAPTCIWTADKLAETLADGASVTEWAVTNDAKLKLTVAAASYTSGGTTVNMGAPTLVKNAANGHAAVRFDAAQKTALAASNRGEVMPVEYWNQWGVFIVYRSSQPCTGFADYTDGAGIFSVKTDGTDRRRAKLALAGNGELVCETCAKALTKRRPLNMNDGRTHVVYFGQEDWTCKLNVDGLYSWQSQSLNSELSGSTVSLGRINNGDGLFTGDIMEVRWYASQLGKTKYCLDQDEIKAVMAELCEKYDVPMFAQDAFNPSRLEAIGLGATNVAVASGATLALPLSSSAPYTAGANTVIELNGTVTGTLALGDGSTLRLSEVTPADVSIEAFQVASGADVNIEISDFELPIQKFTPLFAAGSLSVGAGSTVRINGVAISTMGQDTELVLKDGQVGVLRKLGTVFLFW